MASIALANPTIIINNLGVAIVPNSTNYTEGFGEQNQRAQSSGGGNVDVVFSNNVETNLSKVNFSVYPTEENIALLRSFKTNENRNAISITSDGFSRTVNSAALINDFEVGLGADTTVDVEFMGKGAV